MAPRRGSRGSSPQRNRSIGSRSATSGTTDEPASNGAIEPTQELIDVLEREGVHLTPKAENAVKQQVQRLTISTEIRSAPIPSADELKDYDSAIPGLGERIVEAWLKQSDHRRDMERLTGERQDKHFTRGQWFGLIVAVASIPAASVVGVMGSTFAAGIIITVGVGGPVTGHAMAKVLSTFFSKKLKLPE